ncbi:signal peptidase II [Alkalibacter rhizosphaerae]|uniref:signal peptidase II n=1 Tax=Alkalibacter rhizosphaerae TaxID=2815577 RepID=UPI001FEF4AE2|nr:signal peptidase II [Alkalibacter rhizosphaerae]
MSYFIIFFIVVLDQFSKHLVLTRLVGRGTYPLIDGVFHLTYVENTGAAFSIFTDMQLFLKIVTSIFIIFLFFLLIFHLRREKKFTWKALSLSFVIGGAIGNLIDRFRFQFVVDFFDFRLINFAVFNVADSFIVVGSILLILVLMKDPSDHLF